VPIRRFLMLQHHLRDQLFGVRVYVPRSAHGLLFIGRRLGDFVE